MCPLSMCAPHQACCYSTRLVVSVCYFSTPLFTVHMSHRLALLGCLGIVACASLMQSLPALVSRMQRYLQGRMTIEATAQSQERQVMNIVIQILGCKMLKQ